VNLSADCKHRRYAACWSGRQGDGSERYVAEAGTHDAILQEKSSSYLLVLGERRMQAWRRMPLQVLALFLVFFVLQYYNVDFGLILIQSTPVSVIPHPLSAAASASLQEIPIFCTSYVNVFLQFFIDLFLCCKYVRNFIYGALKTEKKRITASVKRM